MRRYPELDALRGLAALGVVYFHLRGTEVFWYWTSMDFFFVLSSFLLSERLLAKPLTFSITYQFYRRRVTRIWPLYYLAVFGIFGLNEIAHLLELPWIAPRESLPQFLTFTQFIELYATPTGPEYLHSDLDYHVPYSSHLWSLAVEEQFYLLLPALVAAFGYLRSRSTFVFHAALVFLLAASVIARLRGVHFYLLLHHLDAFVLGYYIALLRSEASPFQISHNALTFTLYVAALLSIVSLLPYLVRGYADCYNFGLNGCASSVTVNQRLLAASPFTIFWLSLIGLITVKTGSNKLALLRLPLLVVLGRMSYAMYLIHIPVLFWGVRILQGAFNISHYDAGLLCIPVVLFLSYVVYRDIDSRFQRSAPTESKTSLPAPA